MLVAVLNELRTLMPFALLGFDTDNDSVFINETVRDYCAAAGIAFTRCRPYRKNDQAWVEQKNGSVVRRLVGYRRFEGLEATAALADLYAAARLFVNIFQPSFKLAEKRREGAHVHKRYHAPATPCQRLLDDPRTDDATRERLRAMNAGLDPVRLLRDIRAAQQRLVTLADTTDPTRVAENAAPELEAFPVEPADRAEERRSAPHCHGQAQGARGRRRPDPLIDVTGELKRWVEEEPWRTGRGLLEKLQVEQPGRISRELVADGAAPPEDLAIRASSRARVQRLVRLTRHHFRGRWRRAGDGRGLMGMLFRSAYGCAAQHPHQPSWTRSGRSS